MPTVTADAIMALGRKFIDSRILLSAVELDVFSLLAKETMSAKEVADKLSATLRGTTILLDALVAMDLLQKPAGKYHCRPDVASLLAGDSPTTILPMLMHSAGLWQRWSALTDIVRHGNSSHGLSSSDNPQAQEAFIGAMHVIGSRMAAGIVSVIRPGKARKLLDIGGASGTYAQAFLEARPDLQATLFDLPPVIQTAKRRLGSTGLIPRIQFVAGDFYQDDLPGGHDLALLSAIIHQNSPEQNLALYRKIHRALVPGGRLVIRDHIMNPEHTHPVSGALFAVNMLVSTPSGATYSFEEIRDSLATAGFKDIRLIQSDDRMTGLVEAISQ